MSAEVPAKRVGVIGGTFDPIHLGHLVAASEALHALALDRVVFVPAGHPWQKERYSDAEDRFMMTALAVSSHPAFSASRIEIDRKGPTYTADTMVTLRRFHGEDARLFFIAGADAVAGLSTWKKLEELAAGTEVIAVTRPTTHPVEIDPEPGWPTVHALDTPSIEVSATDIRERVREGRPIRYLVTDAVAAYIAERGLYVGGPA